MLIFVLSTALSPIWAAGGMGDWSRMWGPEIELLEAQLLFKQQDCGLTDELFLEISRACAVKADTISTAIFNTEYRREA